jgi:hypothetical protein
MTEYTFEGYSGFSIVSKPLAYLYVTKERVENGRGHLNGLTKARFVLETIAVTPIKLISEGGICIQRERTYRKPF